MKILLTVIVVSMALTACASAPKISAGDVKQSTNVTQSTENAKVSATNQAEIDAQKLAAEQQAAENAAAAKLAGESIYFDFDESAIQTAYRDVLNQQADWMKTHESDKVMLEGNADERGSPEYNLALGNRRADSVRKALVILGISPQRINVVSFGSQKPRATCQEEKCWQENRRVDFVHK